MFSVECMSWRLRPVWISVASGPAASVMIFSVWRTSFGRLPPGCAAWSIECATPRAIGPASSRGMMPCSTLATVDAMLMRPNQ